MSSSSSSTSSSSRPFSLTRFLHLKRPSDVEENNKNSASDTNNPFDGEQEEGVVAPDVECLTSTAVVVVPFPSSSTATTNTTFSGINSLYASDAASKTGQPLPTNSPTNPTTTNPPTNSSTTSSGHSTPVVGVVVVCEGERGTIDSGKFFTSESTTKMRNLFARKVFAVLTACLLVTFGLCTFFTVWKPSSVWIDDNRWLGWICCAATIAIVVALWIWRPLAKLFPINAFFLFLLSLTTGVVLGLIIATVHTKAVAIAAGMLFVMVIALTVLGYQKRIDFTSLLMYPFALLISLILFGIAVLIFRHSTDWLHLLYAAVAVFVVALYMILHTQRVVSGTHCLHHFRPSEWCFAVVSMTTDVLSFFSFLFTILTCRRCRKPAAAKLSPEVC
eukprot:GHVS01084011.1.p1 GENE.GHVS01084011.1~~GHVS01084011.1.p1  ORF type:complete len:389 (+),score=78.64 GHVS01084011.1:198-1364(+)